MVPGNPDCFDVIRFCDSSFEFRFPTGYERIRAKLHDAFPDDRQAVDTFLGEIKKQCSLLPFLNFGVDLNAVSILENVHGPSLYEFLSGLTDNEYLKSVFSVHCLLNGVPAHEQALNNYAYIAGPYYESTDRIQGGGTALITALENAAKKNGVDIFTCMDADKLLFSSFGDLNGIHFKDETAIACKNCISTIHPLSLLEIVPDSMFRNAYKKRIKSFDETPSANIIYGVSDVDINKMFGANLYLLPSAGSDTCSSTGPLEERPLNIVSIEDEKSESNDPQGFIAICPASIAETEKWADSSRGNRPPEYMAYKEEVKERIIKHVKDFFPELGGKIKALDCSTPLTLRDYSNSPFGSMYGVKHKVDQFNPMSKTRIPGLYLAGQSIVAPGLLGTIISALLACSNILGHDFIRGELKKWI